MGLEEIINLFDKENSSKTEKSLFVFDLANNHNGDVNHGLKIIREVHKICSEFEKDFTFGFKFQYRNLDKFIHPDYRDRKDIKLVKRFLETRLTNEEFMLMKQEVTNLGFVSVCTPFDEDSVDLIGKHNYDIIKISSASLTDWPLLEKVVNYDKPIIASTAGSSIEDIDKVVTFLLNRDKKFCLMHCVAEYPTENKNLQLNQITLLKDRYKNISIGYSTHENSDNTDSIKIAISKGALLFEKHVAFGDNRNSYSATPEQLTKWLKSAKDAFEMSGLRKGRVPMTEKEEKDLRSLRRAVFSREDIITGERINPEKVFYAIPSSEQQLLANDMSKYTHYYAQKDFKKNDPILLKDLRVVDTREKLKEIVYSNIKPSLINANLALPKIVDLELSHHYGLDRFYEYGCSMIDVINRDYCKKFIILLPGQKNPTHFHKQKEESFIISYGNISVNIDGMEREYKRGEVVLVNRGAKHSFSSKNGGIFEEISTTHYKNDSFYEDDKIMQNPERKTHVKLWLEAPDI